MKYVFFFLINTHKNVMELFIVVLFKTMITARKVFRRLQGSNIFTYCIKNSDIKIISLKEKLFIKKYGFTHRQIINQL